MTYNIARCVRRCACLRHWKWCNHFSISSESRAEEDRGGVSGGVSGGVVRGGFRHRRLCGPIGGRASAERARAAQSVLLSSPAFQFYAHKRTRIAKLNALVARVRGNRLRKNGTDLVARRRRRLLTHVVVVDTPEINVHWGDHHTPRIAIDMLVLILSDT